MRLPESFIRSAVATATVAVGFALMQPASASPSVHQPHFHGALHGTPKHGTVATPKPKPPVVRHKASGWPWGVTASDLRAWSRVAMCEEGGNWHVRGSLYSGGLGITNSNWRYFSRGMGFPANAADATPLQQIAVAKKINAGYGVPDQHGCHAW